MDTPSSTLTRASRPRRQKRRDLESESRLMEPHRTHRTHRTNHPYHYESLLRVSRQAPPHTTTSPSSIINVGSHEARKYRDLSDPRKHKSPALSLHPPQVISQLPRQNPPPTYPYDALPVTYWPSRDPIGERGGSTSTGWWGIPPLTKSIILESSLSQRCPNEAMDVVASKLIGISHLINLPKQEAILCKR